MTKTRKKKPFYKQIECEHGWTDYLGWSWCTLGGCGNPEDYCIKENCPINEVDGKEGPEAIYDI